MELGELRQLATRTAGLLERGLAHECITGVFGPELQLRYSMCGIATASLQKYLERRHGVTTERYIKDIPPFSKDTEKHTLSHVTLQHENIMIDPTYSQFMALGGLRVHDVLKGYRFNVLYPREKIAVIADEDRSSFAALLAKYLYAIRPLVRDLPDRDSLHEPDGSLDGAPLASIDSVFQTIWDKKGDRPFHLAHGDGIDALSDRIVNHMERQESGTIDI